MGWWRLLPLLVPCGLLVAGGAIGYIFTLDTRVAGERLLGLILTSVLAAVAVVIVVRHGTTPFAFNEAMWTKYGKIFAANMSANDKVAHPNPSTNVYATRLANLAKQLGDATGRGVEERVPLRSGKRAHRHRGGT